MADSLNLFVEQKRGAEKKLPLAGTSSRLVLLVVSVMAKPV